MNDAVNSEAERIVREWMDRVWNNNDVDAIDELFASDGKAYGVLPDPEEPVLGGEVFKGFRAAMGNLIADINVTFLHMLTVGEEVMVVCRLRGTAKSGPIDLCFASWAQVSNGRIVAARNVVDYNSFLVQLGAVEGDILTKTLGLG